MNILTVVSLIIFVFYIQMAIYIIHKNKHAQRNVLLAIGFICMGMSALMQALSYSAPDKTLCFIYYHIYSPLLILTLCVFLHFTLLLTGKKHLLKKITFLPLYIPALLFGINGIFGANMISDFTYCYGTWFEVMAPFSFLTVSYMVVYFSISFFSILLIIRWGRKTKLLQEKLQARLITMGFLASLGLTVVLNYTLPILLGPAFPRMSPTIYMIMLFSIWFSMFKLDFLGKTPYTIERNPLWKRLSIREKMIVPYLFQGMSYKETAYNLSISEGTLRKHMENIYNKTGIHNKTMLITQLYGMKK